VLSPICFSISEVAAFYGFLKNILYAILVSAIQAGYLGRTADLPDDL
jgi:hypothetical protein